jgi:hypothetical protein
MFKARPGTARLLYWAGGDGVVMTLCERCLDVFLLDDRYVVTPVYTAACEKGDCECFICRRKGRDYDIDKPGARHG